MRSESVYSLEVGQLAQAKPAPPTSTGTGEAKSAALPSEARLFSRWPAFAAKGRAA
jgi:hypothetical protein